jgi:hypothetical protein
MLGELRKVRAGLKRSDGRPTNKRLSDHEEPDPRIRSPKLADNRTVRLH